MKRLSNLHKIIGVPLVFLKVLFSKINNIEFYVAPYELEYLCYRVESFEQYQRKKEVLLQHGEMLIESTVNDRMIATFKSIGTLKKKNFPPIIALV
ncbi:MAG: VOC family protein [Bacteriovorax sp.]|nr:VOC family protein [Bacteriovorax sp.]